MKIQKRMLVKHFRASICGAETGVHAGSQTGLGLCHSWETHQLCDFGKKCNLAEAGSPALRIPVQGLAVRVLTGDAEWRDMTKEAVQPTVNSAFIQDAQGAVGTSGGLPRGGGIGAESKG